MSMSDIPVTERSFFGRQSSNCETGANLQKESSAHIRAPILINTDTEASLMEEIGESDKRQGFRGIRHGGIIVAYKRYGFSQRTQKPSGYRSMPSRLTLAVVPQRPVFEEPVKTASSSACATAWRTANCFKRGTGDWPCHRRHKASDVAAQQLKAKRVSGSRQNDATARAILKFTSVASPAHGPSRQQQLQLQRRLDTRMRFEGTVPHLRTNLPQMWLFKKRKLICEECLLLEIDRNEPEMSAARWRRVVTASGRPHAVIATDRPWTFSAMSTRLRVFWKTPTSGLRGRSIRTKYCSSVCVVKCASYTGR